MVKLILIFILCVVSTNLAWAKNQLNVITALSSHDPMYKGLERFKLLVESKTNQQVEIRLFVGSQLGNDEDILEQAMAGTNVAVLVDGGRLSTYQREIGILGAPYLLQNMSQLDKLVESKLFQSWADKLQNKNHLKVLAFNWWQGSRHLLTNKAIDQPEDLAGVRMRTVGAPIWIESIKAMGATPTPLSFTEVYSGLQQKVLDAAEAQYDAIYGARLYEVTSHITKTSHIQLISGLVTSAGWFDSLTPQQQSIITESAAIAGRFATHIVQSNESQIEQELRQQGLTINKIDLASFVEATTSVYETLGYSELREQVYEVLRDE